MKSIHRNKSARTVLAIVALGLVLGALILSWKKEPGPVAGSASSKDAAVDAGAEGLVRLTPQQVHQAGVATATAGAATIAAALQLPGEVRFNDDRTAHIVPRVPGIAAAVQANLGQAVRKGQVLAVISSPELAEMRSTLNAARTRLELARTTRAREQKLWEDGISAQQDYQQAQQAYEEARIAADNAQSKLDALGIRSGSGALNRYELRAPFDGVIVEKHISLGEAVKEDANVFLLSDLARVWVDVVVTPADLGGARVGQVATVRAAATDLSATGTVTYVGSLVGEQTRAATARVELANPARAWRPGLFVNVALAQDARTVAVAVQSAALQRVDDKPVVFVKAPDGFRAQPVTVGASDKDHTEILQGLSAGTVYAGSGSFVLKAEQGKDAVAEE